MEQIINQISKSLNIRGLQVKNTLDLLESGATIPFISRYRKELTGNLDEVQIADIKAEYQKIIDFNKRKETVLKSIDEQGKLNDTLKQKIENAENIDVLEDIYLPYKQKRKTRATIAVEKGLEPLANIIMKQNENDPTNAAYRFVKGDVADNDEAIQGALDIIAERVSESEISRKNIRKLFDYQAKIVSKVVSTKKEEAYKYSDYFDWDEKLSKIPSHRLLAMLRAKDEGLLRIKINVEEEKALDNLNRIFVKSHNESGELVKTACKDAYKRLLQPSLENEFLRKAKEKADLDSIKVFAENLRQLLLLPPLGQKRVLAIDPGFRTGCKVVCLNEQGDLLTNATIYPHPPQNDVKMSKKKIASLASQYKIEAIAIGNGTASRETERFVKAIQFDREVRVYVVNEAGASIYSASKVAREEFPDYDVTVRGSVSIGRRLVDPLSELVKIEPKSIGVGQYQHDVDQKILKENLDLVVETCVNSVGVDLNTASKYLLKYVAGIGEKLANSIIEYRTENGAFNSRNELKKVSGMGAKAFEQSAGFLRIKNGSNKLDNSAVHPESYAVVKKIAKDLNCEVSELIGNTDLIAKIDVKKYITKDIGEPTLNDIKQELLKPGRDPRKAVRMLEFADIKTIDDVKTGDIIPGIINNITNFGAFVDIGIKQNGLIHVSNMANEFVDNPHKIIRLHQQVMVQILDVDKVRNRIQLKLEEKLN